MLVTIDNNDLVLLTKSQNTIEALPMTNQEMQEESSPKCLEKLEGDKSKSEIIQQKQKYLEKKQFMFGAADNNYSIVLIGNQNNFKALQVTN
jgi:uncharacterized membrane protein (DUF106 family)